MTSLFPLHQHTDSFKGDVLIIKNCTARESNNSGNEARGFAPGYFRVVLNSRHAESTVSTTVCHFAKKVSPKLLNVFPSRGLFSVSQASSSSVIAKQTNVKQDFVLRMRSSLVVFPLIPNNSCKYELLHIIVW